MVIHSKSVIKEESLTRRLPKIALHITSLHGGGAEKVTLNMVESLVAKGVDIELVCLKIGPLDQENRPKNVNIVEIGGRGMFSSIPRLLKYIRKSRPDILLSALHQPSVASVIACKLSKQPVECVIQFHNNLPMEVQFASNYRQKFLPFFAKYFFPKAIAYTAVSEAAAADAAQYLHLSPEKVKYIPNSVIPPSFFKLLKEESNHPWLKDGKGPIIVNLGRLTHAKDHETLLRALKIVREEIPARLIILGEGPLRHELEKLRAELGLVDAVDLPGFAEFPYPILRDSRLFVLSSRHEGLPGVLIESLAAGTPVISTDCPSGPMQILENGKFGGLVPIENPEALAKAIILELNQPRITPPTESWEKYTSEHVVDQMIQFLESVLGRKIISS